MKAAENDIKRSLPAHQIEEIKAFSKGRFAETHGSHDWEHTRRVYKLCMRIGRAEGADLEVLKIAAYLHDVGRSYQDQSKGAVCHAAKGAELAQDLLARIPFPAAMKEDVLHCIRSHRFRGKGRPETLEAKVLFDADKLDAIGAIGIARAFQFAGEVGARFHNPDVNPEDTLSYSREDTGFREFKLKLWKIRERMLTPEGRRIAKERHAFMELFFRRFFEEYEGSK
jgi:uncharacterized protein